MKKKIITILGILYLCGLTMGRLFAQEKKQAPEPAGSNPESQASFDIRPKKEFFKEKDLRDPFKDYFEESEAGAPFEGGEAAAEDVPPPFTVQGVVCGGGLNYAIINDKIVKTGDTIEGALITNIEKDGISIFFSNKTYKLPTPSTVIIRDLKKKPEGGQDEK